MGSASLAVFTDFTSPGFSLCVLSTRILYTVLCDICIVWAMCDTVAPAAFIPMTCHRWLMVLFPMMTKSNWPVTKGWLLGWTKLCWFQLLLLKDYMVNFIHFCQTCYQVYTHHIDNFQGLKQYILCIVCLATMFCCIFFSHNLRVIKTLFQFLLQVIRWPPGNLPLHRYVVHSLSHGSVAIPDWSQAKGWHTCISKVNWATIGSDNCLSPVWC